MSRQKVQPPIANSSNTFPSTYYALCQLYNVPVLTHIMNHESNVLYLDVDRVLKDQDWSPIMKAIKKNRDLKRITIQSDKTIKISGSTTRFDTVGVSNLVRMLPDLTKYTKLIQFFKGIHILQ
jgi:hypothetical protein